MTKPGTPTRHSGAWVFQTQLAFAVSATSLGLGIAYLPGDPWPKAFLGLATLFTISSTISMSKTIRDQHEDESVVSRVDEARFERLLAEHDPFKVPS